ncbi:alpha/beta hydrolase [Pseudonocardia sp. CNS-004]|nr:alpha/beta hydrolase [Pseudonocardia sp. CNS-004]
MQDLHVTIRSRDGLHLAGTMVRPDTRAGQAVVLVHGGGVTREEGGFFGRLAAGLAHAGAASLRFDLRGHGDSEGRQEDLTLAGILGDIEAAATKVADATGAQDLAVVGASFAGGICAYYAAQHPDRLHRLVLLNPLLDYKKRFVEDKPYWHEGKINEDAGRELLTNGYLSHSPTFKLGRALLNEVFYLQPHRVLGQITTPTLLVHGTQDTFIPIDSSRRAVSEFGSESKLVEIHGAQHGFAVHDDPGYAHPQSQRWQADVIEAVGAWITSTSS